MSYFQEPHEQPTDAAPREGRYTRASCWLLAVALGASEAWAGRFDMSNDGVSYLDIGDAYFRRDWNSAINAYWSPLYSWLLGFANWVVKPSSYWEFPLAHLVNLLIYVGALLCFDLFLRELINHQRTRRSTPPSDGHTWLPAWAWVLLGYTLFTWSSLELIGLRKFSPDMLVTGAVYLAARILLRIASRGRGARWSTFIGLGAVLGLGYLSKAPMFPLAFVFLVVCGFLVSSVRDAVPRISLAVVTFLLIASPLVIALSISKGRPTLGDSGKLVYAWYVNGTSLDADDAAIFSRHWQGEPAGNGTPRHPTRRLRDNPPIYEFAAPVSGTYPLWYDPSYWYEGLRLHFNLHEQLRVTASHALSYYGMFVGFPVLRIFRDGLSPTLLLHVSLVPSLLLLAWVLLMYHSERKWRTFRDLCQYWFLSTPGIAAMTMYSLVHVEKRFVAAFVVLVYVSAFAALRLPDSRRAKTLCAGILVPLCAIFVISFTQSSLPSSSPVYWQIADGLRRMGVRPATKIASLQYANRVHTAWARLARARIIAEIYPHVPNLHAGTVSLEGQLFRDAGENAFWMAPDSVRSNVLNVFARAGVDVVVAATAPTRGPLDGWQAIGQTGYFAYFLK